MAKLSENKSTISATSGFQKETEGHLLEGDERLPVVISSKQVKGAKTMKSTARDRSIIVDARKSTAVFPVAVGATMMHDVKPIRMVRPKLPTLGPERKKDDKKFH